MSDTDRSEGGNDLLDRQDPPAALHEQSVSSGSSPRTDTAARDNITVCETSQEQDDAVYDIEDEQVSRCSSLELVTRQTTNESRHSASEDESCELANGNDIENSGDDFYKRAMNTNVEEPVNLTDAMIATTNGCETRAEEASRPADSGERFYKRALRGAINNDHQGSLRGTTTLDHTNRAAAQEVPHFVQAHLVFDSDQTVEATIHSVQGETNVITLDDSNVARKFSRIKWILGALCGFYVVPVTLALVLCSDGRCFNSSPPILTEPTEAATVAPTPIQSTPASERKRLVYDYLGTISLTWQNFSLSNDTQTLEQVAIETLLDLNYLDLSPDTPSHQFKWQQRYALASLLAHQPSNNSLQGDECDWEGVECESIDLGPTIGIQNVTVRLDMPAARLQGSISPDLGLLSSLVFFNVSFNNLTGPLPYSIGRWTDIESFSVGGNNLNGTLPTSIELWTDLSWFDAGTNYLTGSLPYSIGRWTDIAFFSVGGNNLNGTLPTSIELWTDLSWFDAGPNYLTGSLPSLIGSAWSNLKHFNVMVNAMNGTLPDTIGLWTNLEYFSIFAGAWWMGTLPDSIGQWTNLQYFDAAWNRFTGTLPDSVGQWTNLTTISLIYNDFTGTLPASIGNWASIHKAHFQRNNFTGAIPDALCDAETRMMISADRDEVECSCCT